MACFQSFCWRIEAHGAGRLAEPILRAAGHVI
jgi:hypothetical protein